MSIAEVSPTWFGETGLRLLECARTALEDDGGRAPGLAHLTPGSFPAWDNCCESGGQLYVRMPTVQPSGNPFPTMFTQPRCAPPLLAVQYGVGVIRCTPTLDDSGEPPTAEELTASALELWRDAHVLQEAILCCLKDAPGVQTYVMGAWNAQGAEGGCAGGEWTINVGLPSCEGC